jgi:hypothetical protein
VSFEGVGLVDANTVRGFVVLEATVGKCTQVANVVRHLVAAPSNAPGIYDERPVPPGTDPSSPEGHWAESAFKKEAGHLLMTITQSA